MADVTQGCVSRTQSHPFPLLIRGEAPCCILWPLLCTAHTNVQIEVQRAAMRQLAGTSHGQRELSELGLLGLVKRWRVKETHWSPLVMQKASAESGNHLFFHPWQKQWLYSKDESDRPKDHLSDGMWINKGRWSEETLKCLQAEICLDRLDRHLSGCS